MSSVTPPARIAFCITDLDPGGAERALVQLIMRLDRQRWTPAVFCLAGPGALVETLTQAGVPVTCFGARRARQLGVVLRLALALRRFRPEILQCFLFHANMAGRIAGRLAGVRSILSGIRVAEKGVRTRLWLDRLTQRLVTANVCVSQAVADFSAEQGQLPRQKLVVIGNGVDFERFATATPSDLQPFGIPPDSRVLITVGRLDRQKGLQFLLAAAEQILPRHPDVHVLLVGEGPRRLPLEEWIAERGLAGRIHLTGWQADVPGLLRAATALVHPALWEGMPNAVLEAMAAGLPVIATRVEGMSEIIPSKSMGQLIDPGSAEQLAAAIEELLSDPDRALERALAGQRHVAAEFSWDRMAEKYAALYAGLLS